MIVPNKIVTLENSALGMVGVILDCGPNSIGIKDLFHKCENKFESIDQFLLTIDLLYVLGKVDLDFITRTVSYVD